MEPMCAILVTAAAAVAAWAAEIRLLVARPVREKHTPDRERRSSESFGASGDWQETGTFRAKKLAVIQFSKNKNRRLQWVCLSLGCEVW